METIKGQKMETTNEMTEVQIPGTMIARVQYGQVTGFDFSPSASYAGYFGPEINIIDGPDIPAEDFWDMVSKKLAITSDQQTSVFVATWES